MNKVSVIIPSYNCAAFIKEALNSVINQSILPHEIIVVDDGSTDDTEESVRSIETSLVRYVRQANAGVSAARNLGLEIATGDFITFLDADDRWLPTMLERQLATLLVNPDVVLSFTNFVRFDDPPSNDIYPPQFKFYPELESIPTINTHDKSVKIIDGDGFCQLISFCEIPAYTQSIMLKKSLIHNLRFDTNFRICEDMHFILRCATMGKVAFDNTILLEVRRHANTATRDISLIPQARLACFINLSSDRNLNLIQSDALQSRLIRAYWSASKVQAQKGLLGDSWKNANTALKLRYPISSKIKHFLSWVITVLISVKNIQNNWFK